MVELFNLHASLARKEGKRGLLYRENLFLCFCPDCAPYYYKDDLVLWVSEIDETYIEWQRNLRN